MSAVSVPAYETRTQALSDLSRALRLRYFWAHLVEPDELRCPPYLVVTNPARPYQRATVVADIGYGAVEWFWWQSGGGREPITPADDLTVAAENVIETMGTPAAV